MNGKLFGEIKFGSASECMLRQPLTYNSKIKLVLGSIIGIQRAIKKSISVENPRYEFFLYHQVILSKLLNV